MSGFEVYFEPRFGYISDSLATNFFNRLQQARLNKNVNFSVRIGYAKP